VTDDIHEELIEEYDDVSPQQARKETLHMVSFNLLQKLAGDAGVYEQGDNASDLKEKLAEEGYFVGPIGDNAVYKRDNGAVEQAADTID